MHITTLTETLSSLPPDELVSFDQHFSECLNLAQRWDLWGAAYWMYGGCSDDGFWDFRACLISLGRDRFDRVLRCPDDLAEMEDEADMPYLMCEGFQYVANQLYEQQTGESMPPQEQPTPDMGEEFDFDDEQVMARRFPKLVAKYPEMGG